MANAARAVQTGPYRIPHVFVAAHARGFSGFPSLPNPETLFDPATGRPVSPEAYSHETVLKRRAPNANKKATQACLKEFGIDKTVDKLVPEDYRAFIEATARRMLARLEEAHPMPRPMSRVS